MAYQSPEPPDWRALHGTDAPPIPLESVAAGPVELVVEGIDLRYLAAGGQELVRRITVAVRDPEWGTVPALVEDRQLETSADGFALRFRARHREGDIDFTWEGLAEGSPDGTVRYSMKGAANSSFLHNRIGICVLLTPEAWIGRDLTISGPAGAGEAELPRMVAPQRVVDGVEAPVVGPFTSICAGSPPTVDLRFSGDLFEMEDQRNWTDASFKVYSTLLSLGYPHRIEAGDCVAQEVVVSAPETSGPVRSRAPSDRTVRLVAGEPASVSAPSIGLCDAGPHLTAEEEARIADLGPAHIRVEIDAGEPSAGDHLSKAAERAGALGAGLELALRATPAQESELDQILGSARPELIRRLIVIESEGARGEQASDVTSPQLHELVRRLARDHGVHAPVGTGSALGFCELNRDRPSGPVEGVYFPMSPTIHASDERSIMETLGAQGTVMATASAFADGAPIWVTPITLGPDLANPDPRIRTQMGAVWVFATYVSLAPTADSVTFVAEAGLGPGSDALATIAAASAAGRPLTPLHSSDSMAATGLVVPGPDSDAVFVANLKPEPLRVEGDLGALRAGLQLGPYELRRL